MKNLNRRFTAMILAVLMCTGMMPAGVFAVSNGDPQTQSQTETQSQTQPEEEKPARPVRKTLKQNGYKLKFKTYGVLKDAEDLNANSEALDLKVKTNRKSRKLTWKYARKKKSVDGYIVLKQKGNKKPYTEIAVLGRNARSYTDKKAKSYQDIEYTVVGFKKEDNGIRISPCSGEGRAPGRKYQNPSKYVQIKNKISKHGLHYYTSPVLVNNKSTKKQHIEAMIKTAFKYEGDPFTNRWSRAPGQGVDCSAYVWRIFQKFDIPMPRLSAEQAEWGKAVASMDDILPGDLLFYRGYNDAEKTWTEGVGHVAIYVGNGFMIHAASESRGITVDKFNYVEDPICIRRVITD